MGLKNDDCRSTVCVVLSGQYRDSLIGGEAVTDRVEEGVGAIRHAGSPRTVAYMRR